jgi:hypothetical protein
MNKEFQLITLSMPNSTRFFSLKRGLEELNIKNCKVFDENDRSTQRKTKNVYLIYNKNKAEKFIARLVSFNEIGAELTLIKTYKYIDINNLYADHKKLLVDLKKIIKLLKKSWVIN